MTWDSFITSMQSVNEEQALFMTILALACLAIGFWLGRLGRLDDGQDRTD